MATEILINDGGAPSRILPFVASEDISAGEVLKAGTTGGECSLATVTTAPILGVALTDAGSGSTCNVISGRGIIVNIQCTDEAAGANLMVDGTAGQLDLWVDSATAGLTNQVVACTLENNSAAGLTKCMLF